MTERIWTFDTMLPDGHRLFFSDNGFAIADDSGATPDETDDGILWLNFDQALMLDTNQSIPLTTDDGRSTRTPTDVATIVLLASRFNWPVNTRGILFDISRH